MSLSQPHTSELAGEMSVMCVRPVRHSIVVMDVLNHFDAMCLWSSVLGLKVPSSIHASWTPFFFLKLKITGLNLATLFSYF